jgi:hypothetical protein
LNTGWRIKLVELDSKPAVYYREGSGRDTTYAIRY